MIVIFVFPLSANLLTIKTIPNGDGEPPSLAVNPLIPLNKVRHRVPHRRRLLQQPHPRPLHSSGELCAGTGVVILAVKQSLQPEVPFPRHVPVGMDRCRDLRLHDHVPCELLPRPAEVAPDLLLAGSGEAVCGDDFALVKDEGGGLVAVNSAVGEDDVLLVVEGAAEDDEAVLEDGGGVAEDEVHGAGDDAAALELALGLGVEGVLKTLEAAVEEDGPVRLHAERHRLVLDGAGGVADAELDAHKSVAGDRCT
ncbi:hypothetical protein AXF42_Ash014362 [Apostasia shenzhenica]|uniref:Uncharacterized protein n=1 Tax=Apostasia shenzhenica TaxID=1088818 RepID=A0A2I0B0Z1_9ASPA|nr:hypothetical protein AXF42_Ash014362 [Apostasia shenzhenica]